MKAQARKILALIMAMVMCLSLAAPAFAASEEAPEAPEASTSAEVETEAPEGEKEEKSLEAQNTDPTTINSITLVYANTANEGFTVDTNVGSQTYKWGASSYGDFVTVTTADYGTKRVGEYKQTKYTVTAKSEYTKAGETAKVLERVVDDVNVRYSLDGTNASPSVAWTELTNEQNWADLGTMMVEVKGSVYQEQQADGKWTVYAKLTPTKRDTDGKLVYDTSADAKPVYVKALTDQPNKLSTDVQFRNAIQTLASSLSTRMCNVYGETTPTAVDGKDGYKASATCHVELASEANSAFTYSYAKYSENGASIDLTRTNGIVNWDSSKMNTTATVRVRATYDANEHKSPYPGVATTPEKDADLIKADLEKKQAADAADNWTLVSVTADGEYMNVVVEKKDPSVAPTDDNWQNGDPYTNVNLYNVAEVDTTNPARVTNVDRMGLVDLATDGTYYAEVGDHNTSDASKDKKTIIKAGTKVYGQVAVKKSDMPEEGEVGIRSGFGSLSSFLNTNDNWYYFSSEGVMKDLLQNLNCGKTQTVKYKKLILNQKDGSKTNTYTLSAWATQTDAFTEDATWTIEKNSTHVYRETVTVNPSTCKTPGSKVTETKCKICGNVKDTKTETLPIDQTSVLKTTKTSTPPYVYNPNDVPLNPGETHWIKEEKITTTLATKEAQGSIKHEYICNYGEIHDELTWTETTDKDKMEHSGRWDNVVWTPQNTAKARNPQDLFGYTLYVFDTDFETPTLPLNDQKLYDYFTADSTGWTMKPDGTYEGGINAVDGNEPTTRTLGDVNVSVATKNSAGTKVTGEKFYKGSVVVKDIKQGEKDCVDGSATIEVKIYEVSSAFVNIDSENAEKAIKDNKAVLVNTITKNVVIPAEKTHVDANADGLCDNCGNAIEQNIVEPVTGLVDISTATVKFGALTYTGKVAQPTVTVTLDGVKLAKGIDYEVEEMQDVNAGTYPLIVKGKGDFTGRVVGNVTINKAAQPMTVKATAPSAKKLKKKAQKVGLTIKKAQGKVTVKVSGPASVKGTTVTAKKGTKKGKKIKITVTAAGNDNYKKGSKTVTVKVKA